jgi:diguanylate cyclase (GGDEF)-like protein
MAESAPSENSAKSSGFLAFEEKIADQIDAMIEELDTRLTSSEAMLARLRQAERSGMPWPGFAGVVGPDARDHLTGLYSRQEISKRLAEEKNRADRTVKPGEAGFALLALDITGFREINSSYGLTAGDFLLGRFGQFIKSSIRSYDVLARFSGDEFIAILPGASKSQAIRIAKTAITKLSLWHDFRRELAELLGKPEADFQSLELGCSVGISDYISEGKNSETTVDAVISRAEYALYRARRFGKRRYAVWGHTKERGDA